MNPIKSISLFLSAALLSGCCSTCPPDGPKGPELVSSGRATESGNYAEVGLRFTTFGDFVALFSPSRWRNPVETGGSLSWLNPIAWSEDAGRTGRILLGEVAIVGGVAAAAAGGSSSGSSGGGGATTTPPPPTGGGGGTIPGGGGGPPPAPGGPGGP